MVKRATRWARVKALSPAEKIEIGVRCDAFISDVLAPRFLPAIRPTEWNYPIALHGKWRGSKYSFFIRYRSGFADNLDEEFDSAWVRLDHHDEQFAKPLFHIMWHRHTGQWYPLHASATLDEALDMILNDGILQPHV
jgi:hypothetical protein